MKLSKMTDDELINMALQKSGYDGSGKVALTGCFLDYVDSGTFQDLDFDQAKEEIASGDITVRQMAIALIRMR